MACPEVERWSEAAQSYEDIFLPVISFFSDKCLAHHHALWDPARKDPVLFVEVAAGPGHFCQMLGDKLREAGKQYTILCTDAAPAMVDMARERVTDPNVEFKVMDGQDLSGVANRTVDGVNCFSALMFMPEPERCLREMRRVLKEGALATVGTWSRAELGPVADKFGRYLGALGDEDVSPGHTLLQIGSTPEGLQKLFKGAGFRDVKVMEEEHTMNTGDVQLVYRLVTENPVMRMSIFTGKPGAKEPSLELFKEFMAETYLKGAARNAGISMGSLCNITVATA